MYIINIKRLHMVADSRVGHLAGAQMDSVPVAENAWLRIRDGKIKAYGDMKDFGAENASEEIYEDRG